MSLEERLMKILHCQSHEIVDKVLANRQSIALLTRKVKEDEMFYMHRIAELQNELSDLSQLIVKRAYNKKKRD